MTIARVFAFGISLATATIFYSPAYAEQDLRRGDLKPITAESWNADAARHLLHRAGFGGTPEQIQTLAAMTPAAAVDHLVAFRKVDNGHLPAFEHSGIFDDHLDPFPPSRPATTNMAKKEGGALGVKAKPKGNRRLQAVVNRFFYWLRASHLETDRLGYWWANRMLRTNRPLQEKLALFWHGHFAVSETKVRDYRKLHQQLELFHAKGDGKFRDLLIGVAQGPAMLSFLDAGINVKGAPNENFAREIMELFTMGVGHYSEHDVREAARAFTGWNYDNLTFRIRTEDHDEAAKTVLSKSGNWDGVDIINIILAQPATADYLAGKLYRYFVNADLSTDLQRELGALLRSHDYDIAAYLRVLFLSRDFYSEANRAAMILSPVQLAIATYRKLNLQDVPGVPDFNTVTAELGQYLFRPPTVAGWAGGQSWITPSLLLARGNFAYDILFPDINFVPHDRYPRDPRIRAVNVRLANGFGISNATVPNESGGRMSMSNMMADRDEDFNTRYGSYRGWQMAIQKVKPISRHLADVDMTAMIVDAGVETAAESVEYLLDRFLVVDIDADRRTQMIDLLREELGTDSIPEAVTYMEEPFRLLLHTILSQPEYQLG